MFYSDDVLHLDDNAHITGGMEENVVHGGQVSYWNPQYVPGVQMGGSEAPNSSGDYVYRQNAKKPIRFYEFGGDIKPLDENGNERIMPKIDTVQLGQHFGIHFEQKKGNVETYQLNLKGKKGKSSASKDYVPEGTKKNGKYLHYTEEGLKWLDDPVGLTFEQEASEGTVNPYASGYEYINGQGWTYKGVVPAAPSDKKEKKTSTIHNNNLGLTHRGELSDWYISNMDKPNFGYTNFEDFQADWPTAELEGGVAITGEGGPEYSMDQERKPEKLIKLPSRSIEQIPTSEMEGPQKLPPFELMKNNSSHFTIQRQGLHSGTYPKGEDGLALMVLKDQAGRVVWKGSQTEYEKNYGDFLEKGGH